MSADGMSITECMFMRAWRLTPSEARVVLEMLPNGFASNEQLHQAISQGNHTDIKIVRVVVCRLRKALDRQGVEILTRSGAGYELAPGSAAIINRALGREKIPVAVRA